VAVGDPKAAGEEKLDEEALRAIASTTGGGYFFAGDREQLEEIYHRLDELDTREVETISHRPKRDLFHWPLACVIVLSLFYHMGMWFKTLLRESVGRKVTTEG
jgi:Ca-activated chloride channel family protein